MSRGAQNTAVYGSRKPSHEPPQSPVSPLSGVYPRQASSRSSHRQARCCPDGDLKHTDSAGWATEIAGPKQTSMNYTRAMNIRNRLHDLPSNLPRHVSRQTVSGIRFRQRCHGRPQQLHDKALMDTIRTLHLKAVEEFRHIAPPRMIDGTTGKATMQRCF
jgi:hypothetical protein